MFEGCPSLVNAPEIKATKLDLGSMKSMFKNCPNLQNVTVHFTNWDHMTSDDRNNWLSNVNSNGTFYKPSALPEERGDHRIPEGWTVVNIEEKN